HGQHVAAVRKDGAVVARQRHHPRIQLVLGNVRRAVCRIKSDTVIPAEPLAQVHARGSLHRAPPSRDSTSLLIGIPIVRQSLHGSFQSVNPYAWSRISSSTASRSLKPKYAIRSRTASYTSRPTPKQSTCA